MIEIPEELLSEWFRSATSEIAREAGRVSKAFAGETGPDVCSPLLTLGETFKVLTHIYSQVDLCIRIIKQVEDQKGRRK
jgi:hypothetical protein